VTDDAIVEHLPTRFSQLARQKPRIGRAEALRRGASAVENLREDFEAWLADDLASLADLMRQVHEQGGFAGERYRAVYARAQSIRDLAGTFGRQDLTDVADNFCELIFRMGEARAYEPGPLTIHFDALRMVCHSPGMVAEDLAVLLDSLRQLVNRFPDPDARLRQRLAQEDAQRARKQAAAERG
jgi:hypothetical protein